MARCLPKVALAVRARRTSNGSEGELILNHNGGPSVKLLGVTH